MLEDRIELKRLKCGWINLFTVLFLILVISDHSDADSVKQTIESRRLVPASLIEWNSGPDHAVLVDKSKQKVMVFERGNLFEPYRVYNCSTGEKNGPKLRRNDRKTPEGVYFFTGIHLDKDLAPIYGTRALPLNYPNLIDEKEGKGGYGIWFHGTNRDLKPNDTNGCVALENRDIEELAGIVKLFDTPVVVSAEIEMVYPESLDRERQELMSMIEEWRSSWEGKDIDKYMSLYSKKFTSGWRNWNNWRDYKKRLAKNYSYIKIDIDDLGLISLNGVVLATFKQNYRTPSFDSYGSKTLYITRNSDEWKIMGESFREEKRPKTLVKSTAEPSPEVLDRNEIEKFIDSWKIAWESQDTKGYISYYDKDFESRGMNLKAWEEHRDRLNSKYASIKVVLSNIKIKEISNKHVIVSFEQKYSAGSYRDKGIKELTLIRKDRDWKITREDWTPIR